MQENGLPYGPARTEALRCGRALREEAGTLRAIEYESGRVPVLDRLDATGARGRMRADR